MAGTKTPAAAKSAGTGCMGGRSMISIGTTIMAKASRMDITGWMAGAARVCQFVHIRKDVDLTIGGSDDFTDSTRT